MTRAPDRFEVVAIVYDQPQLALLLALFESERIWVVPTSYYHATAQWSLTVGLGGVQLRVLEPDAPAARRLLSEIDPSLSPRSVFSDNRFVESLLILGLFLVGFFAPPARIPAHFLLEGRTVVARGD